MASRITVPFLRKMDADVLFALVEIRAWSTRLRSLPRTNVADSECDCRMRTPALDTVSIAMVLTPGAREHAIPEVVGVSCPPGRNSRQDDAIGRLAIDPFFPAHHPEER